ncbi:hypothetical protein ACFQH2_04290 [Natronoarchaeum sp. GCM10025703]|uniref:hypothetical protein n=1 Tax=unclassified Natronoarchaeum TaxID=2620183 RepID=UPI00360D02D2
MGEDRPTIRSRSRRLVAYLSHNRTRILVDVALLTAWVLATSAVFGWLDLPNWLLYVVVFTGVVAYARFTPTWERPYRSPD